MSQFQLADVTLEVNDDNMGYEPNTLIVDDGISATTVRAASTGGGSVELIFGQDVADSISEVEFELPTTERNIELVRAMQQNVGGNTVALSSNRTGSSFSSTITQATVTNKPKYELTIDGTIKVEMKGNPAV